MAENKDQHYVPKMLMKRFANPAHLFSFAYKSGGQCKPILDVSYDKQCQYDYYYGRDKEWEHQLGEVESNTSPIFDRIINDSGYYPTKEEINIIKEFFLAQRSRTPRIIEWEKNNIRRLYLERYRLNLYRGRSLRLTNEDIAYVDSTQGEEFDRLAKKNMKKICFSSSYLSDLECIIVHFDCKTKLVLSDDPVIVINPFIHSAGIFNIGIIMLMPISPSTLVVLRDPVLYEPIEKIIVSKREKAVNCLNIYQATTFDKRLMFSKPSEEDYILKLINNTESERNRFVKTGSGAEFSSPADTMLIVHPPTLSTNYPYAFSSIKKSTESLSILTT